MTRPRRHLAVVALVPLVGALVALASIAHAQPSPSVPQPGAGPADLIVGELEALGYTVAINWVNGRDSTPSLSRCRVVAFHNPDRSAALLPAGATVYVDVLCPDESED